MTKEREMTTPVTTADTSTLPSSVAQEGRSGVSGAPGQGETSKLVSGHTLRHEGAPYEPDPVKTWRLVGARLGYVVTSGTGHAMCSCGATSDSLTTAGARKRWHRQHKAEVLAR